MAHPKARKVKIRHDDETRAKIQAAQIINRFQSCLDGKIDLTTQQVTCGKILLNKVLPDLSAQSSGAAEDGSLQGVKNILDDINGRSAGLPEYQGETLQ